MKLENKMTLDTWMTKKRWSNTAFASALTNNGHKVSHSHISEIRHKRVRPSGNLAVAIYKFVEKEVPIAEILNETVIPRNKS